MSKSKKIFSGLFWTVAQNTISIIYGLVSVPYLISYFGKEEYGLIGIALSVNIYIQLLDLGMTNSNVRFLSEFIEKDEKGKVARLFNLSNYLYIIIGIINTVLIFGISFFSDVMFKITPSQYETLRNLLWVLALNAIFSWISAGYDQLLRAYELIDWIKKRATYLKFLQFIVLIITINFSLSIYTYFFLYSFIATIILPLTILKSREIAPYLKYKCRWDKNMATYVMPYSISLFSFGIFHFLTFNFRPLILGANIGPSAVADYNIMNTIATVITMLSGSFLQVLLPIVTRMSIKKNQDSIKVIMTKGTKYVTMLLTCVIFTLVINIEDIIRMYVGEDFVRLAPWMTLWLLTLLLSHRNVLTSLVFTEKKLLSVSAMGCFSMICAFASYLLLVPVYGVGGVVIGFMIHELIHTSFYYIYFIPNKCKINTRPIFIKNVLPIWIWYAMCGMFSFNVVETLDTTTLLSIVFKILIFISLIMTVNWFIIINKDEKKRLIELTRNML